MMRNRVVYLLIVLFCGLGLAMPSTAIAQDEAEAPNTFEDHLVSIIDVATASSEVEHRINVETLSCGEFVALTVSGSETDRALAAMLMVWAHGYHSGLQGLNFEARPVSMEAMVKITRDSITVCRDNPEMLFHTAISKID